MSTGLSFVSQTFQTSFVILLLLGCVLSLLYGVWMLRRPEQALRFNRRVSAWVSTDGVSEIMDKRHTTERFVYRHHRSFGVLLLAGGIFTLYVMSGGRWGRNLTAAFSLGEWSWLAGDLTAVLMIINGTLATVLGILMFVRPSLLRGVEAQLNRWIATENELMPLDAVHDAPDRFASRHVRLVAVLIVIGSLYALIVLVPSLRMLL